MNAEEIDEIYEDFNENVSLSKIEKWCNDFAYYFLAGEHDKMISSISDINTQTDYQDEYITSLTFEIPLRLPYIQDWLLQKGLANRGTI